MGPTTRQVHEEFDYFSTIFSDNYEQIFLGSGAWDDYGLGTTFDWSKMEDLKGVKIGAAGPNLPWLDYAGAAQEIGRAHVCTPVTNAHLVCRRLLEKNTHNSCNPSS